MDVQGTKASTQGRVFAGVVNGGPSRGFTAKNLQVELLHSTRVTWVPGKEATANLNGSYPNLDCYTVPAACVKTNTARMGQGLLSRDGWAVWDDVTSPRFVPPPPDNPGSEWYHWHDANDRIIAADLYFFGHGLDYKAALRDFLQISGAPGMLSAPDYGLWWSNSRVFTKEEFLDLLIANFTKHALPFTHLVMDLGWHQPQDGRLWASYTWDTSLFGDSNAVIAFVQSLHSTATTSPLERAMSLSLNLHPVGVEPPELRYSEFQRALSVNPALNATIPCTLSNATWMAALFDQVSPIRSISRWFQALLFGSNRKALLPQRFIGFSRHG